MAKQQKFEDWWDNFTNQNPGYYFLDKQEIRNYCFNGGFIAGKVSRQEEIDNLQQKIDALMLEFCPEDMTQDQIDTWAKNQVTTKDQ